MEVFTMAEKKNARRETARGDKKVIPLVKDPKAIKKHAQGAAASENPTPQPEQFCYVNAKGEIIRVDTVSGKETWLGLTEAGQSRLLALEEIRKQLLNAAFMVRSRGAVEHIKKMSLDELETFGSFQQTLDSAVENTITFSDRNGNILDWIFDFMPNYAVYSKSNRCGRTYHPEYIFLTAEYSLYAIIKNRVMPIYVDNGIMRCDDEKLGTVYPSGPSILDRMTAWNRECIDTDHSESVIVAYLKVPRPSITAQEVREIAKCIRIRVSDVVGTVAAAIGGSIEGWGMYHIDKANAADRRLHYRETIDDDD